MKLYVLTFLLISFAFGYYAQDNEGMAEEAIVDAVEVLDETAETDESPEESTEEKEEISDLEKQKKILEKLSSSIVTVEFTLKYDKGEGPKRWAQLITGQRPLEVIGYAITDSEVLIRDLELNSRFVKKIEVNFKGKKTAATFSNWYTDRQASTLKLSSRIEGLKALDFDVSQEGPYFTVSRRLNHGNWTSEVSPLSLSYVKHDNEEEYFKRSVFHGPVVNAEGQAIGFMVAGEMPLQWQSNPVDWDKISEKERLEQSKKINDLANTVLPRVTLKFRSPRKKAGYGDTGEYQAERQLTGIVYAKDKVLVLANIKPQQTALLQTVTVHIDGKAQNASFVGTLKDYGAIVVKLDKEVKQFTRFGTAKAIKDRHGLYYNIDVRIHGKMRNTFYHQFRFSTFKQGWKKRLYSPYVSSPERTFVFSKTGELMAFPLSRRLKSSEQSRWGGNADAVNFPSFYVTDILKDLPSHVDESNVPVQDKEEARLAWIGVKLQALNSELARINKVSKLTNDGSTGAIVTFVYKDSPADKAGIKVGMLLLRLHVEGEPKPLEVVADGPRGLVFPWQRYGNIPEQYYDRIPTPWKPSANQFTIQLTNIGFDKKFKADFFDKGKVIKKDFVVVKSPDHYDTVAQYKNKDFGITVRNLSYEVRSYFNRKKEQGGVVVSKIELGSLVSIAGVKPYEIVTHVDKKAVHSVEDFEKLINGRSEINLTVLRMSRVRYVKVK